MFFLLFRRNKVYASWKLYKTSISVNRGSHFEAHFVWQVWDGQLSPAFKSIRLKAFGGWKVDRGTTQLHARILRGKGVQMNNTNRITVRNSTSATFVLPVRHGTGVALCTKRIGVFQNPQSTVAIPIKYAFFTLRHGTGVALYTKRIGVFQNP